MLHLRGQIIAILAFFLIFEEFVKCETGVTPKPVVLRDHPNKNDHQDKEKKEDKKEESWNDADIDKMFGGGVASSEEKKDGDDKEAKSEDDESAEIPGPFGVFLPGGNQPKSSDGAGKESEASTMATPESTAQTKKPSESYSSGNYEETCIDSPHRVIDIWDRILMLISFPIVLSCVAMQTEMFR